MYIISSQIARLPNGTYVPWTKVSPNFFARERLHPSSPRPLFAVSGRLFRVQHEIPRLQLQRTLHSSSPTILDFLRFASSFLNADSASSSPSETLGSHHSSSSCGTVHIERFISRFRCASFRSSRRHHSSNLGKYRTCSALDILPSALSPSLCRYTTISDDPLPASVDSTCTSLLAVELPSDFCSELGSSASLCTKTTKRGLAGH
jgi:hypothetical protein